MKNICLNNIIINNDTNSYEKVTDIMYIGNTIVINGTTNYSGVDLFESVMKFLPVTRGASGGYYNIQFDFSKLLYFNYRFGNLYPMIGLSEFKNGMYEEELYEFPFSIYRGHEVFLHEFQNLVSLITGNPLLPDNLLDITLTDLNNQKI